MIYWVDQGQSNYLSRGLEEWRPDTMTPIITFHAAGAIAAFWFGLLIFGSKKGTRLHRHVGWLFVVMMLMVALSALFIQAINPGQLSIIHILVPITLASLWRGVRQIKRYRKTGNSQHCAVID